MTDAELITKYEKQIAELKRRLAIDTTKLSECLEEQPTLYLAAREAVVDCTALRDRFKHNLEFCSAERDAQLREEAVEAGNKLTEVRLAAMMALDPDVCGRKTSLIDANALVGKAQAVSESYSQRSWMLRELSQIHAPFERDRFGGLSKPSKPSKPSSQ